MSLFAVALTTPFVAAGCYRAETSAKEDGVAAASVTEAEVPAAHLYCARMPACGLDGGEADEQCHARLDGARIRLREQPVCEPLAHSLEDTMRCGAKLSCEALSAPGVPATCNSEVVKVFFELLKTNGRCDAAMGDDLFAPGDGHACKADSECPQIACADGTSNSACIRNRCGLTARRVCAGAFQWMFGRNGAR